jgi:hypothetical protein
MVPRRRHWRSLPHGRRQLLVRTSLPLVRGFVYVTAAVLVAIILGIGVLAATGTDLASGRPAASTKQAGTCRPTRMKLSGVTRQPDGTTVYHFTAPGTWSNETVAPRDFDPLKATNAELLANGFPPRPPGGNVNAFAAWKREVENVKRMVVSVPVLGCTVHFAATSITR